MKEKKLDYKIWERVEDYFFNNLCSWLALFIGIILMSIISYSIDDFLSKLLGINPQAAFRYSLVILYILWILYWIWKRKTPSFKDGKFVIVIAIRDENDEKKTSLIKDFKEKIEELLASNSLNKIFDIVMLDQYYSDKVVPLLRKDIKNLNILKITKKLSKKQNHFLFIYGDVKERMDGIEKCFLKLDAILRHQYNQKTSEIIKDGFNKLWVKTRCFEKNREFHGFITAAEDIFYVTRYVVGMALLASGDIERALKLHESLYNDFSKLKNNNQNIFHIKNKLKELLIEENFINAYNCFKTGDFINSEKNLIKSMEIGKSYPGYLLQSNLEFSKNNNPRSALDSIAKARKIANNDGTWRYNKGFLMMYIEEFSDALKIYQQIAKPQNKYENDEIALQEVIEYNENFLIRNPTKIWSNFIIGFLKYKKIENGMDAYGYFEKFLKDADGKNQYKDLIKEAKQCVLEIDKSYQGN
jgi:hypothetical protein